VRLHNNFIYILVKLLIRSFRDRIGSNPLGDKMKFLRRFWRKTKLFSTIIWQGLEEAQMRKTEWYLKNNKYID
jgi:hypothetical protein